MGVININPSNSRASSWDGSSDTSTVEKDIITVVHATFELEDYEGRSRLVISVARREA